MIIQELQPIFKIVGEYDDTKQIIDNHDIYGYIKDAFDDYMDQEQLWIVCLNGANIPICRKMLSLGTSNHAPIYPKEIFKVVFLTSAVSFILCHNHPSGNLEPSDEDIAITKKIIEIAKMTETPLLDHTIITPDKRFLSIRANHRYLWF